MTVSLVHLHLATPETQKRDTCDESMPWPSARGELGWLVSQCGVDGDAHPLGQEEMSSALCASGGAEALTWLRSGPQEAPTSKHTRSCFVVHLVQERKAAVEQGQDSTEKIPLCCSTFPW